MMVTEEFKTQIHSSKIKHFLHLLYSKSRSRYKRNKLLHNASTEQLDSLLSLMHYIVIGEIPLKREHHRRIKETRRLNLLVNNLHSQDKLKKLLRLSRTEKISFLKQFSVYPELLHWCFTDPDP